MKVVKVVALAHVTFLFSRKDVVSSSVTSIWYFGKEKNVGAKTRRKNTNHVKAAKEDFDFV